ncbi:MAG: carbonic anhydrase [Acetobacterium sp.]
MDEVQTNKVKRYITCAILVLVISMLVGCTPKQSDTSSINNESTAVLTNVSGEDSLKLLEEGDARFIADKTTIKDFSSAKRSDLSNNGQTPFAVVVSCSDSRVPPEEIFDQGLGDLFVIRVAGNVIDPVTLGSIEYGVEHLNSQLVVVMGHEKCGAVKAALDGGEAAGSIGAIVEKIQPSVEIAKATGATDTALYDKAIEENVRNSIAEIEKSPLVEELVAAGKLKIVGARYDLDTGKVEYYPEV